MSKHRAIQVHRVVLWALNISAVLLVFGAATASAAPVQAKQADSFVESIGVNVHLTYSDTPYGEFSKVDQVLQELGVRYLRDGVGLGRRDVYSEYRALAAQGIKLDLIVGDPLQRYGVGSLQQQLDMIEQNFPEAIATLESPNEYDGQGDSNWVIDLRTYVREMSEEIHARPVLASKPILGPSLVSDEDRAALGNLSQWTDQGNMHPYPGGQMPDLDAHAASEFSLAAEVTAAQPVQATETGYQNAVNEPAAGHRPTSERAAGIYTPRMYLDNFRRGIVRTYDYELLDTAADPSLTEQEAHFGLVRNDWTPKPAYTALQRLIELTEDPGSSFAPEPLDFNVQNDPSSEREVLLERRDGTYDLVLWNAVSVWNTENLTELDPSSPTVNLNFEQSIKQVEVFRPNESANAVSTAANVHTMSLPLGPAVTVLRITPAAIKTPAPSGPEPLEPNSAAPASSISTSSPTSAQTNESTTTSVSDPSASTPVPQGSSNAVTPSVRAKLRVIARRVRSGCANGCPLKGAELQKARVVLRARRSAGARQTEQAASWLKRRQTTLAGEGTLEGRPLLRYLTIELVLKTAGRIPSV